MRVKEKKEVGNKERRVSILANTDGKEKKSGRNKSKKPGRSEQNIFFAGPAERLNQCAAEASGKVAGADGMADGGAAIGRAGEW